MLAFAIFLLVDFSRCLATEVDVTEINHYCQLSQVIYWDLHADGEYHVVAWRILGESMRPTYSRATNRWVATWRDPKADGQLRKVSSVAFRETWTGFDPEILDRTLFDVELRRGL